MKFTKLAIVGILSLAFLLPISSASAATSVSEDVQFEILGGDITVNFLGGDMMPVPIVRGENFMVSKQVPGFSVNDNRGTVSGWNVQAKFTPFELVGDPSVILPRDSIKYGYDIGAIAQSSMGDNYDATQALFKGFGESSDFLDNTKLVSFPDGQGAGESLFGSLMFGIDLSEVDPNLVKTGVYTSVYSISVIEGP
jgi:hypothetical protein